MAVTSSTLGVLQRPAAAEPRRRRPDRLPSAALLSLAIHLLVALAFVATLVEQHERKEKVGSVELDVDLVAPRLAPPLASTAVKLDRRPRRAGRPDGVASEQVRGAPRALAQSQRAEEQRRRRSSVHRSAVSASAPHSASDNARASDRLEQTAASAERQHREARQRRARRAEQARRAEAQQRRARRHREVAIEARRERRESPPRDGQPPTTDGGEITTAAAAARESQLAREQPAATESAAATRQQRDHPELPATVDPLSLLAAVERDIHQRRRRKQRHLALVRQRDARLHRRWRRFVAASTPGAERAAVGRLVAAAIDPAATGAPARAGAARGRASESRRSTRYGLKFYLSGRQRKTSKIVRPPQLVAVSKNSCHIADPEVAPATVRTLITLDGDIGLAYIRRSSGNRRFDRCALRQVRGLRFKPGTDLEGRPLDVWVHIRVSPGLPQTVL